jgi:Tfp pilus assembly protein PilN
VFTVLIGKFIFENYRQALDKIHSDSHQLAALARQLNTTDADYKKYLQAEREYLHSLKTEPKEVQQAVDYMEVLAKLTSAKYIYLSIPFSGAHIF